MTATEHTLRRAGRFKAYPAYANKSDPEIIATLEDALQVFFDITHRSEDPGQAIDSLICDIAKTMLARGGQEGIKKAKDGEFEREWSDQQGSIDAVLLKRIKAYRQVVGVNATPLT